MMFDAGWLRFGNLVCALAVSLFVGGFLYMGAGPWGYSGRVMFFPALAGSFALGAGVWLALRSMLVSRDILVSEGESLEASAGEGGSGMAGRLAWLASVLPAVHVLGYLPGLMLFALAYTSSHRLPWWQRLVAVAVVFTAVYPGFHAILGVPLPVWPLWMR